MISENHPGCFQNCGSEREFALVSRWFEPTHVGYGILQKPYYGLIRPAGLCAFGGFALSPLILIPGDDERLVPAGR